MESSTHSKASGDLQYATSDDGREDYSFSVSGLLVDKDDDSEAVMLSRALKESISFSFSTENSSETDCGGPCPGKQQAGFHDSFTPFGFTLPLPPHKYADAGTCKSFAGDSIIGPHDEDREKHQLKASLIPFEASGSWEAESLNYSSMHAESRRSFSFLTQNEYATEHFEYLAHDGSVLEWMPGPCDDDKTAGDGHVCGKDDDDSRHARDKYNHDGGDDDKRACGKHNHDGDGDSDGADDKHVCGKYNADDKHVCGKYNDDDMHARRNSDDDGKHADCEQFRLSGRAPDDPKTAIVFRFAGEALLQPWSSSKLSKTYGHQEIKAPQDQLHFNNVSPNNINHLHPLPSQPANTQNSPVRKAANSHLARRMNPPGSEPLSPSIKAQRPTSLMGGGHFPSHGPQYMPTTRKPSSLFARRRMQHASEIFSLTIKAQRPTSWMEEGRSPPSNGSSYSSSYRTSSNGSALSSGYSSSSGKSSTPNSRSSSRNASLTNVRCSLRKQLDEEPSKTYRKWDPNDDYPHGEGDPNAHTQAQSKLKADPFVVGSGHLLPSPSPRSPLNWRSVLSLQPLNPSHVPLDEWELLARKSNSRSLRQRSRSSSRSSSGEGRRKALISATTSEVLRHSKHLLTLKEGGKTPQKVVNTRRGYWALNPLLWFKHCRNQAQVVNTINSDPMEQTKRQRSVGQACR